MTEVQERLLWEAVAANTNSLNLLASLIRSLDERIATIEWRQEAEVQAWRDHWGRFIAGGEDAGDTMFGGESSERERARITLPHGPDQNHLASWE